MAFEQIDPLVEQIHARACPLVVVVTGGGSGVIAQLLRVPGASRTVLQATVPYAAEALTDWLGGRPENFCSSRTARAMAMVAYRRGRQLTAAREPRPGGLGLACTASLASDRPKKGEHRAHLAWQSGSTTLATELVLRKGHRSRGEEEDLVARWLLLTLDGATQELSATASLTAKGNSDCEPFRQLLGLLEDEQLSSVRHDAPLTWRRLLSGDCQVVGTGPAAATSADSRPRTLFPGAFNPRHHGHEAMARLATERLGRPVEFELSVANVDKPPLDFVEMADRQQQFAAAETLWFTQAPTFVEKSRLFPGSTFVVGADTIARIGEPRYYRGGSPASQGENRDAAIDEIAALGCRFLVFGRRRDGRFESIETIEIPDSLRALCAGVSEAEFRADVSSTELRQRAATTD